MNKKGFVFVETIIIIAVLTTVLLMLYSSFISILNQERRNATFDDSTYIYRTFYVEDFLVSLNLDQYIDTHLETPNEGGIKPLLATFTCHDDSLYNLYDENGNTVTTEKNKKDFCEYLIDGGRMEITNVYITRYNIKDLVNCVNNDNDITCKANPELRNLSPNAISYLRNLSGDSEGDYRLIIEYKTNINNKDHYMYSNVKIVKRNNNIISSLEEYTINTKINPEGFATMIPSIDTQLIGNDSVLFTTSPITGYVLDSVSCTNNQKAVINGNTFKVQNLTSDTLCNVNIDFKKYQVSVKINPANTATVDATSKRIQENQKASFNITHDAKYRINGVSCTNGQVGKIVGNKLEIDRVTNDTECTINMLDNTYTVTTTVNPANTATLDATSKVIQENQKATFNITPNAQYKISSVSCTNGQAGKIVGNSLVIDKVTNNTACTINMVKRAYTVTATVNPANTATLDATSKEIEESQKATFNITPNAQYKISSVSCTNNQAGKIVGNSLVIDKVTNNTACTINMVKKTYTVNLVISPSAAATATKTSLTVEHGANATFNYTPKGKYYLNTVTCSNRESVTIAESSLVVNSITKDTTCTANFVEYTLAKTYSYTGQVQSIKIEHSGTYKLEAWGAKGGDINGYVGGKGAYTSGTIRLNKGETLYIYVGAVANNFNGGGSGISQEYGSGAWGGGATDFRLTGGTWSTFDSLKSRIMVAAGGGGADNGNKRPDNWYWDFGDGNGGAGGTLVGLDGTVYNWTGEGKDHANGYYLGKGATQTAGGSFSCYAGNGTGSVGTCPIPRPTGSFGKGGNGQAGGGGGYYGGGYGDQAGAGGGSSFVSGCSGCNAIASNSTASNIIHTNKAAHYSGKVFSNIVMTAGNASMPNPNGSGNVTGNSGNGVAKVTYIGP